MLRQRQYQTGNEIQPKASSSGLIEWLKTSPVAHVGGGALLAVLVLRVLR